MRAEFPEQRLVIELNDKSSTSKFFHYVEVMSFICQVVVAPLSLSAEGSRGVAIQL